MQDTLNMLRTLRKESTENAYEELHGVFDWNKTPLAPLGNKGMVYITPDTRDTFVPHCNEAFTVSRAPFHHQLFKLFVPATKGYRISGTCHLDPTHWTLHTVSEHAKTLCAVTDLLTAFRQVVHVTATDKQKHVNAVRQLTTILCNNPQQ
jgi:hypothetical protein